MLKHEFWENEFWCCATKQGLATFLQILSDAERNQTIGQDGNFGVLLDIGLQAVNLQASDIVAAEKISKAAVSRWLNDQAVPSAPTRKQVLGYLKHQAENRLDKLTQLVI